MYLGFPVASVETFSASSTTTETVGVAETTVKRASLSSNAYIYIGIASGLVAITIIVVLVAVIVKQQKR